MLSFRKARDVFLCTGKREGDNCMMMVSVLRDPMRLSNWKLSSMNRAIHQLQGYQQLFQDQEERRRRRSAKIDQEER
ncbi:unnamed protein product [Caenorhabditis auriculariae]|uniref:Uncharacterized protein n=1 Tax=Caenorhabditis auriculariae TaxID=2777116 RepID=A0A8S1H0Z3_9PELO|nr:unnamed protein product [Caenorhabditis auriculariae]